VEKPSPDSSVFLIRFFENLTPAV
jgi:hypothetical protein